MDNMNYMILRHPAIIALITSAFLFKETQNSNTDRVLTILFGPESRFIEIRGNSGM